MSSNISAYYSNELKSWVRLERCEDGEYCHTSGYATKEEALNNYTNTVVSYKVLANRKAR
jgi:hypothetical protein